MRMWYLIIPPIVVVVSLGLLVWYLSRKGNDPAVLDKLAASQAETKKVPFLKTKKFFLRLLEKLTQRFKIGTLRMHNSIGGFSQSLRKKRERVAELAALEKNAKLAAQVTQVKPSGSGFFGRFRKAPVEQEEEALEAERRDEVPQPARIESSGPPQAPAERLASQMVRRRKSDMAPALSSASFGQKADEDEPENPRPMVSDQVTEPEIRRKRGRQNITQEEALIQSIAENPKDFTAFEALGDYYMSTSNIKDAKECYRQVLKLRPVHRLVKIKIRRLEKIILEKA